MCVAVGSLESQVAFVEPVAIEEGRDGPVDMGFSRCAETASWYCGAWSKRAL